MIVFKDLLKKTPKMSETSHPKKVFANSAKLAKAAPGSFLERYREIVSDPLNLLIERVPDAGYVDDAGCVILHNGHRVPVSGELAYYDDFSDILVINRGVHEPLEEYCFQELLKAIQSPAPKMIELGAYWGHYSMWMMKEFPKAECVLVEPEQQNLDCGKHNFEINNFKGKFIQAFVGNTGFKLDEYAKENNLQSLDLLHSDIQGYELEMLNGGKEFLSEHRADFLFVSTHHGDLHASVERILMEYGYNIEVSSGFNDHTTSHDGFVMASSPKVPPIFKDFSPLGRTNIAKSTSIELIASIQSISAAAEQIKLEPAIITPKPAYVSDIKVDLPDSAKIVQSNYDTYHKNVLKSQPNYLDYPRTVSIETLVRCNAACSFCPYPLSERKGERMDDDLVEKIIDDLSVIPKSHRFSITLTRINEPLLDSRLQYFHDLIKEKLPQARCSFWSNGTTLRKGKFEWMNEHKNASLTISLNSVDEEEHKRMMGFGLKAVLSNLDYLHGILADKTFNVPVTVCAPYENPEQAQHLSSFCAERWPLFKVSLRPYFVWAGDIPAGLEERENSLSQVNQTEKVGEYGCGQWYDLNFLANGFATKCCIDEKGFIDDDLFDSRKRSALEIYGESRSLREKQPGRKNVNGCEGCVHLG